MKKYIGNKRSKEIHRRDYLTPQCYVDKMSMYNYFEFGGFRAWLLRIFCGYNGCAYCWPEKDNG